MAAVVGTIQELGVNATGSTVIRKTNVNTTSTTATGSTAPQQLKYTLQSLSPAIGSITKGGSTIGGGATFTQADINNNVILFVSDPTNKTVEYVYLTLSVVDLSDPAGGTKTVKLPIRYTIPDTAPTGTVGTATVSESKSVKIGTPQLNFTDLKDAANAIIFMVQSWPIYGDLILNGVKLGPGSTFSQDDVTTGKLIYQHNGDTVATEDDITFKVRDAHGNWTGSSPNPLTTTEDLANVFTLKIKITHVDLPLIIHTVPVGVETCSTYTILSTDLFTTDEDDPTLPVTFTVDTPLPVHFVVMKGGSPITVGATFTAADIAAGLLTIVHDCSDTPSEDFLFEAAHSKQTVTGGDLKINQIVNKPPNALINPLQVPSCSTAVWTKHEMTLTDPEKSPDASLIIKIKTLPTLGVVNINGAPAAVGATLTYADYLAGALSYTHNCVGTDVDDLLVITVIDDKVTEDLTLPILIVFTVDKPPYVTVNNIHLVERQGDVTFDKSQLDFKDDDTDPSAYFFTIKKLPAFGTFYINGAPATVGQTFARNNWDTNTFRYVANVTDKTIMKDECDFQLNDLHNIAPDADDTFAIVFTFPPPPVVCPTITNEPLKTAFLTEKAYSEVTLFATTDGTPNVEEVWTLLKLPTVGELHLNGTVLAINSTWTSQDIVDEKLTYVSTNADTTITGDQFDFSVTNGYCALGGTAKIDFLPGLRIEKNNPLLVNQADTGIIDDTLLLSDSGSAPDPASIVYTVTGDTKLGALFLNGVQLFASDPQNNSWTQADINAGVFTYIPDQTQFTQTNDSFPFSVTDGIQTLKDIFKIVITLIDQPPVVVINGLTVGELTCGTITTSDLNVNDRESTPGQLVFTIVNPTTQGSLYLNNTILDINGTFTYQDIINGGIQYCSTVIGALLDSFDFNLVDSGGNEEDGFTFPITIIPPPPAELINKGLVMNTCTTRAITPLLLGVKYLRSTTDRTTVVFTLKSDVSRGELDLNGTDLQVGDTWTLQDIYANLLTYTSSTYFADPDSFDFTVASNELTVDPAATFKITFNEVNNPPWICLNNALTLFEGETKAITLANLQMCDVDLDYDDVTDPDPDSAEGNQDPSLSTYPTGDVMTENLTDPTTGIATRTIALENVGESMIVSFTVKYGSARAYVRAEDGTILFDSACQTVVGGTISQPITSPGIGNHLLLSVTENCVTAPRPAIWTLNLTKV